MFEHSKPIQPAWEASLCYIFSYLHAGQIGFQISKTFKVKEHQLQCNHLEIYQETVVKGKMWRTVPQQTTATGKPHEEKYFFHFKNNLKSSCSTFQTIKHVKEMW